MINGKKILAIIPARGGSKGIPRKNIRLLAGKPLIVWTIEEAKKSRYIDRLMLSSEDEEIISIAKEWNCDVPFKRPQELAQDNTPGIEPVIHAINNLPEKYDYVCLLQPTSPLRTSKHIDACIEKCIYNNAESCVSVCEVDKHPYWMYKLNGNQILMPFFEEILVARRQDLPKIFAINGAVYIATINQILSKNIFVTKETLGYVMDRKSSVDIDDEVDFSLADYCKKLQT